MKKIFVVAAVFVSLIAPVSAQWLPMVGGQFNIAGLPIWSAAVRSMKAGTRNARVLFIGDSTTAGYDPSNGTLANNNKAESHPTVFASLLTSLAATSNGILSLTGNQNAVTGTYDTRVTFPGGGWGFSSSVGGEVLGGFALSASTSAHAIFTPGTAWDTVEIYYTSQASTGGSVNVLINSSTSIGTLNTLSGSTQYHKQTFTKTLGNDTLEFSMTAGTQFFLEGYILYNSAIKEVNVLNAGWSGALSTDLVAGTGPFATLLAIPVATPDLVVIDISINDANQATPTTQTTFKAAVQQVITASVNAGADVLLVVPVPGGTANMLANQANFQTWLHDLATLNNLPILDFQSLWVSESTANGKGWMNTDTIHPNILGYQKKAAAVYNTIWTPPTANPN